MARKTPSRYVAIVKSNTTEAEALLTVLGCRMVRMIETHSHEFARGLLHRIEGQERCQDFLRKVPREELERTVQEIYQHLGEWLTQKTECDIELRYTTIGERRAFQGVSLSHLVCAIIATKEHLWEYVFKEVMADPRPLELFQDAELAQLVEQFFDRAIYFAAIGYERYRAAHGQAAAH
jgi:hypothetical protein